MDYFQTGLDCKTHDFKLTSPYSFIYIINFVVLKVYPREPGCSLMEQPDFCTSGSMALLKNRDLHWGVSKATNMPTWNLAAGTGVLLLNNHQLFRLRLRKCSCLF